MTSLDPVNLAFGTRYSLLDLIKLIEEQLEATVHIRHTSPREGDVRDSQADSTLLRSLFPDIKPVTLADGLAQTLTWMKGRTP